MKPICVACQRFYRMEKSGYYFIEAMPVAGGPRRPAAGTSEPQHWTPYKVWAGDLWTCEGCGHRAVVGVGTNPLSEHYQSDFTACVERTNAAQLQVNDC